MKNNYAFPLIDVVLYAKNHYKRTSCIWHDMALCLYQNGDGYGPFFGYIENDKYTDQERCIRSRKDICQIIAIKVQKVISGNPNRLEQIWNNISPQNSWSVGYYTKDSCIPSFYEDNTRPDWEYWEAVLRAHLSELASLTAHELGYDNWEEFKPSIKELTKEKEVKKILKRRKIFPCRTERRNG